MAFPKKKIYGQSGDEECFFCDKKATGENLQLLPVCVEHKDKKADEYRCVCGNTLEIRRSKWGAFFLCSSCGPISLKKVKGNKDLEEDYNINKRYRKKAEPKKQEENKIFTLEELEEYFNKED